MKLFDANCVLGRWSAGGPSLETVPSLLAELDRLGIERALVRHSMAMEHDASEGNALLDHETRGQSRLIPCWAALPPVTGEMGPLGQWLESAARAGARAMVIYPSRHGYPLSDWQCGDLLQVLASDGWPLLIDANHVTWDQIHWVCSAQPQMPVLLLNSGYRALRPIFGLLAAHNNLFLEMGTVTNFGGLEALVSQFGAERLVFGSGMPLNEGAALVNILNYSDLAPAALAAIGGENLERLLRETQP